MIILNIMLVSNIKCQPWYSLRVLYATGATIGDFFFLSGYLLTIYYSRLIELKHSEPVMQNRGIEYGTFKESSKVEFSSNTNFEVPYTGQFTSITDAHIA